MSAYEVFVKMSQSAFFLKKNLFIVRAHVLNFETFTFEVGCFKFGRDCVVLSLWERIKCMHRHGISSCQEDNFQAYQFGGNLSCRVGIKIAAECKK